MSYSSAPLNELQSGDTSVPMLEISGLNVYYGESHILRDVDMSVFPGKMVCLIGRNGVGKTTLLKSIMGLLKPRAGAIAFAGQPINAKTPDQRAKLGIGYVPQGREIIPRLTVKENLLLGLEARARPFATKDIPEKSLTFSPSPRPCCGAWAATSAADNSNSLRSRGR